VARARGGRHAWIHLSGLVWTVRSFGFGQNKNPFGWVDRSVTFGGFPCVQCMQPDEGDFDWRVDGARKFFGRGPAKIFFNGSLKFFY
jgi:hypothetical protein